MYVAILIITIVAFTITAILGIRYERKKREIISTATSLSRGEQSEQDLIYHLLTMKRALLILAGILSIVAVRAQATHPEALYDTTSNAQQHSKVNNFMDIARNVRTTECRHTHVYSRIKAPNRTEIEVITISLDRFAEQHAQMIDTSDVVNYDCDTLYIFSSTYLPMMSTNYQIKCNKGIYSFTDDGLAQVDTSDWQSSEEMFEVYKSYPKAYEDIRQCYEYHPFSYEYVMVKYTCWDDEKLIRNLDNVSDIAFDLVRIIIHDHEVVYFDQWSW